MQKLLREWSPAPSPKRNANGMLDQASLPWFAELNRGLRTGSTTKAFAQRLRHSVMQLRQLASETLVRAQADDAALDAPQLQALLAEPPSGLPLRTTTDAMLFPVPA